MRGEFICEWVKVFLKISQLEFGFGVFVFCFCFFERESVSRRGTGRGEWGTEDPNQALRADSSKPK